MKFSFFFFLFLFLFLFCFFEVTKETVGILKVGWREGIYYRQYGCAELQLYAFYLFNKRNTNSICYFITYCVDNLCWHYCKAKIVCFKIWPTTYHFDNAIVPYNLSPITQFHPSSACTLTQVIFVDFVAFAIAPYSPSPTAQFRSSVQPLINLYS